jgi:hypothetical protein
MFRSWNIDVYMQHGHGTKHGQGHAVWTGHTARAWTCNMSMNMGMDMTWTRPWIYNYTTIGPAGTVNNYMYFSKVSRKI